MLQFPTPLTLRLERGRLLRWQRSTGVRLRVVSGRAWVTQADDEADHFIRAGQTLDLRPATLALIEADADLVVCFESECRFRLAAWWRQRRLSRERLGVSLPLALA